MVECYRTTTTKNYPYGFRKKVAALFPDDREMVLALESFSMDVGRKLLDNSDLSSWTTDYVIANIEGGTVDDLLAEAKHAKLVAEAYSEWCEITQMGSKIVYGSGSHR